MKYVKLKVPISYLQELKELVLGEGFTEDSEFVLDQLYAFIKAHKEYGTLEDE